MLRVVGVEPEPFELASIAWPVVGHGRGDQASWPVPVGLVLADAERVLAEYAASEVAPVSGAVAALGGVAACGFGCGLASVAVSGDDELRALRGWADAHGPGHG
jgi:hypothetical protein